MCGNGTRVFAAHLRREGPRDVRRVRHRDPGRVKRVRFEPGGLIAVNLGPGASPTWPTRATTASTRSSTSTATSLFSAVSLDLGNPHTVVALPESIDLAGLDLSRAPVVNPAPPHGTNIEFVRPQGLGYLSMRVYERGVGETRSCGTGACAAALATRFWAGERAPDVWTVDVPGGRLRVTALPGQEVEPGRPGRSSWPTGPPPCCNPQPLSCGGLDMRCPKCRSTVRS